MRNLPGKAIFPDLKQDIFLFLFENSLQKSLFLSQIADSSSWTIAFFHIHPTIQIEVLTTYQTWEGVRRFTH